MGLAKCPGFRGALSTHQSISPTFPCWLLRAIEGQICKTQISWSPSLRFQDSARELSHGYCSMPIDWQDSERAAARVPHDAVPGEMWRHRPAMGGCGASRGPKRVVLPGGAAQRENARESLRLPRCLVPRIAGRSGPLCRRWLVHDSRLDRLRSYRRVAYCSMGLSQYGPLAVRAARRRHGGRRSKETVVLCQSPRRVWLGRQRIQQ